MGYVAQTRVRTRMDIITLDAETFFDDAFTLKKMTTEAYIRDPRFEVHGWAIRYPDGRRDWVRNPAALDVDWAKVAILCHHAAFDGLILSHHYGIKPKLWLDTLSMARLMLGNHVRASLESLAAHFGLAPKTVPYNLFKGLHWHELDAATQQLVAEGACHDVGLTWAIFQKLLPQFPREELDVISLTVKMFTEPQLLGDIELLGRVWTAENRRKRDALAETGATVDDLQSSARFASLLVGQGVEPAQKEGKNGLIYAFAKTDPFMQELLEHDNPAVAALAAARLGHKSTIDQTRAERLGFMAGRGPLCVYLGYCAAHTTRWGGGDKVNFQNLRRGGDLRRSIMAPPGHRLAVVDLSQIECRILNYLAGEQHVLERFRSGNDVYAERASEFYGRYIQPWVKTIERHLGKILELGCGFKMGPAKLRATCRIGALGGPPIILDDAESHTAIQVYRSSHPNVVNYWSQATQIIPRLAAGHALEWGPMQIRDKRIYLPNGAPLHYETLEYDGEAREWRLRTRHGWSKLYDGKLVENVVQALARVVMSQAMLRLQKQGLRIVTCTHDEVVCLISAGQDEQNMLNLIIDEMKREPTWLPGIPLDAEGFVGERYEK